MLHPAAGVLRGSALTGGLPPARVTGHHRSDGRDDLAVRTAGAASKPPIGPAARPVARTSTMKQPAGSQALSRPGAWRPASAAYVSLAPGKCAKTVGNGCRGRRQGPRPAGRRRSCPCCCSPCARRVGPRPRGSSTRSGWTLRAVGPYWTRSWTARSCSSLTGSSLEVLALRAVRNSRSAASSDSASTKVVRSTVAKAGSWVRGDLRPPQGGCVRNHLGNLQDVGHRVVETEATPQGKLPPLARLSSGGVSERPKDHVSNTCEGETPPWVQIPPPPLKGFRRRFVGSPTKVRSSDARRVGAAARRVRGGLLGRFRGLRRVIGAP